MTKKPILDQIYKEEEFLAFIDWIGLPSPERVPKNQRELAFHLGVEESTLSNWKKTNGFWEEVRKKRIEWAKDKTSNVLLGLYRRALKEGGASEVKLFLQYAGEFNEKTILELEGKVEKELSPEDRALLEKAIDMGRFE